MGWGGDRTVGAEPGPGAGAFGRRRSDRLTLVTGDAPAGGREPQARVASGLVGARYVRACVIRASVRRRVPVRVRVLRSTDGRAEAAETGQRAGRRG